jgi:ABC-type bacteriocin/lantibiotic exporter with double-glycine peptidase domain
MLDIKQGAVQLGFDVDARQGSLRDLRRHLRSSGSYAILHVHGDHFVAVLGIGDRTSMRVADPALGVRDLDAEAFREEYVWEGAMLLLRNGAE